MILEYSVKNYKVFKEEVTISFIASNYDKENQKENFLETPDKKLRILKSAVIYGANASGKTKLLESLRTLRHLVINSSKNGQQEEPINVQPFLLSSTTENAPTEFNIIFLDDSAIYRYGCEVTRKQVLSEWLFYKKMEAKTREVQIFYRDTVDGTFEGHQKLFKKGNMLHEQQLVRANALMLSVAAQFNDSICSKIVKWFTNQVAVLSTQKEIEYKGYTMKKLSDKNFHDRIMKLLEVADLSIREVTSKTMGINEIPTGAPKEMKEFLLSKIESEHIPVYTGTITTHYHYDETNRIIGKTDFMMEKDESDGTKKYFYLTGPIINALETGQTLFIDEFDARLHPNLVLKLFALFNNSKINGKGAQLIITAQNSIFLKEGILRKDQLWFIEKDQFEAAHLYALSDFKSTKVRKGENFETSYLKGKYGAVPFLNEFTAQRCCEKE
jgi:AAA15 family ATPase/GTPase